LYTKSKGIARVIKKFPIAVGSSSSSSYIFLATDLIEACLTIACWEPLLSFLVPSGFSAAFNFYFNSMSAFSFSAFSSSSHWHFPVNFFSQYGLFIINKRYAT